LPAAERRRRLLAQQRVRARGRRSHRVRLADLRGQVVEDSGQLGAIVFARFPGRLVLVHATSLPSDRRRAS